MAKMASDRKALIGVVDDEKARLKDLEAACKPEYECQCWHTYEDARDDLVRNHTAKPDLLLIDCCLRMRDQGDSTGGIDLARELCREPALRGLSIFLYTRFAIGDTNVRFELESLLSAHRARTAKDVLKGNRRVINRDLKDCEVELIASESLKKALDRRWGLGLPPL